MEVFINSNMISVILYSMKTTIIEWLKCAKTLNWAKISTVQDFQLEYKIGNISWTLSHAQNYFVIENLINDVFPDMSKSKLEHSYANFQNFKFSVFFIPGSNSCHSNLWVWHSPQMACKSGWYDRWLLWQVFQWCHKLSW